MRTSCDVASRTPPRWLNRSIMSDRPADVHLQHFRDQLAEQRDRKKDLERRGQAIVATNGAIVTLVFAFAHVGFDTSTGWAIFISVLLGISLGVLLWSAGCGLIANRPGKYGETDVEVMKAIAADPEMWAEGGDVAEAQRGVAENIAMIIESAKGPNEDKGLAVGRAVDLQVLGLIGLAVTLVANVLVIATINPKESPMSDATEQSAPADVVPSTPAPAATPAPTETPAPQDGAGAPAAPMYGYPVEETKSDQPDATLAPRIVSPPPEHRTR